MRPRASIASSICPRSAGAAPHASTGSTIAARSARNAGNRHTHEFGLFRPEAAIFVRELCGTRKSLDAYPIGAPGPMEIRERLMVRLRSRVRIECLQHAEDR